MFHRKVIVSPEAGLSQMKPVGALSSVVVVFFGIHLPSCAARHNMNVSYSNENYLES
jgi:hypothetical protein